MIIFQIFKNYRKTIQEIVDMKQREDMQAMRVLPSLAHSPVVQISRGYYLILCVSGHGYFGAI